MRNGLLGILATFVGNLKPRRVGYHILFKTGISLYIESAFVAPSIAPPFERRLTFWKLFY